MTKSFNRSLTKPDWTIGDDISVLDSASYERRFRIVDTIGKSAVIKSDDYEFVKGQRYRIIYPAIDCLDKCDGFYPCLGFGGYQSSRTTDYFYSDYFVFDDTVIQDIPLVRINSFLDLNVLCPCDALLQNAYLTSDKQDFCIKGDFDFISDIPKPHNVAWDKQYDFLTVHTDDELTGNLERLEKGKNLNLHSTIYPLDFSTSNFTLCLTTENYEKITATFKMDKMEPGCSYEYSVSDVKYDKITLAEISKATIQKVTYEDARLYVRCNVDTSTMHNCFIAILDASGYLKLLEKKSDLSLYQYVKAVHFSNGGYSNIDGFNTYSVPVHSYCIDFSAKNLSSDYLEVVLPVYGQGPMLQPSTEYSIIVYAGTFIDKDAYYDEYGYLFSRPILLKFKTLAK